MVYWLSRVCDCVSYTKCIVYSSTLCVFCGVQKDNDYQPYDLEQVRHIAWQLCKAVKCMCISV